MLKRLSFTSNTPLEPPQSLLYPTATTNSPLPSPNSAFPFPSSPSTNSIPISNSTPSIDSKTLHSTIDQLSNLLIVLDEFRILNTKISICQVNLSKRLKDLSIGFNSKSNTKDSMVDSGKSDVVFQALMASSRFFDNLIEVDGRFSKFISKEFESLNEIIGKGFKKLAKEEKQFESELEALNTKVIKATTSYERSRPIPTSSSSSRSKPPSASEVQSLTDSHNRYISTVSILSNSISNLKFNHSNSIGVKREILAKEVGKSFGKLCEGVWKNKLEGVKKGGERIGEVLETSVFCENGVKAPSIEEENFLVSNNSGNGSIRPSINSHQVSTSSSSSNNNQSHSSEAYSTTLLLPPSFPTSTSSHSQSRSNTPTFTKFPSLPSPSISSQQQQSTTNARTIQPRLSIESLQSQSRQLSQLPSSPSINSNQRYSQLSPQPLSFESNYNSSKVSTSPTLPASPRPLINSFNSQSSQLEFEQSQSHFQSQSNARSYSSPRPLSNDSIMNNNNNSTTYRSNNSVSNSNNSTLTPSEEFQRIVIKPQAYGQEEENQEIMSPTIEGRGSIMEVWDDGLRLESFTSSEEKGIKKPIPTRYVPSSDTNTQLPLDSSINEESELRRKESTLSERSFVARMREKYLVEKEMKKESDSERGREEVENRSNSNNLPTRSNSRVADLAARYSISPPSSLPISIPIPELNRHQSQSVQPEYFPSNLARVVGTESTRSYSRQSLPSTPTLYSQSQSQPQSQYFNSNQFNQIQNQPYNKNPSTRIRFSDTSLPSSTSTSNNNSYSQFQNQESHSDICGCEVCTSKNYSSVKSRSKLIIGERENEELIQRGLIKNANSGNGIGLRPNVLGENRRLSMPIIFGSSSKR